MWRSGWFKAESWRFALVYPICYIECYWNIAFSKCNLLDCTPCMHVTLYMNSSVESFCCDAFTALLQNYKNPIFLVYYFHVFIWQFPCACFVFKKHKIVFMNWPTSILWIQGQENSSFKVWWKLRNSKPMENAFRQVLSFVMQEGKSTCLILFGAQVDT